MVHKGYGVKAGTLGNFKAFYMWFYAQGENGNLTYDVNGGDCKITFFSGSSKPRIAFRTGAQLIFYLDMREKKCFVIYDKKRLCEITNIPKSIAPAASVSGGGGFQTSVTMVDYMKKGEFKEAWI